MSKRLRYRWHKGRMLREIRSGIFLSLVTCFMLCIFAPLEIYAGNQEEVWYDAYLLFPFCIGLFCALMLISIMLFGGAYLIGDKVYDIVLACYFFMFAGAYIQGNFGVSGLPPFDGTEVNWAAYRRETIGSTVCWFFIAVAVFVLLAVLKTEKFRKVVSAVGLFMFAVLFSTLAAIGIREGLLTPQQFVHFTKNDQFEMSQNQNFIILVLDAIDEECFWQVWEQHPEYQEAMADFTFYNNALTGYPYTDQALPLMLSGEWYECEESMEEYTFRVYRNSSFFKELKENGYELSFYDGELPFKVGDMDGLFQNLSYEKYSLSDPGLFWKRQIKMIGVKYAPWLLKPYCWFNPDKMWHQRVPEQGEELFVWENKSFYDDINSDEITYTDQNCFKMIHLMGAHVPFYYDQYVNEVEDADYFTCIESSMTVTMAYLEKLKAAGVYDNSIILVLSDHGYNISEDADSIGESIGRQHPILFIKGLGEKHDFQISGAPISYEDLVGAYSKLLSGLSSDAVFEYQEGDYRERRYFLFKYMDEGHLVEYIQKGYAGDESTMVPTGRVYDYK